MQQTESKLVNLTGTTLKVAEQREPGRPNPCRIKTVIEPCGQAPRIVTPKREWMIRGIEVARMARTRVVGLPKPEPNTFYIVPPAVLEFCANRTDLLAASGTFKDPTDDNATLCTSLVGYAED